jgi:hypothetical protein
MFNEHKAHGLAGNAIYFALLCALINENVLSKVIMTKDTLLAVEWIDPPNRRRVLVRQQTIQ